MELIKTQVATEAVNLGKVTVDNYVEELIKENITVEAEVTDNGDGSKTVTTDTGYSVTILPKGDRDVEIIIDGKAGALPPRIKNVTLTREGTTIIVDVEAIRTEGAIYKYYYKTANGEYQTEPVNSENTGSYTITEVDEEGNYKIKVELSNEYGTASKEVESIARPIVIYKDGKLVEESIKIEHETIEGEDRLGNKVVLPGGFRTATDTGETVKDGIVVEDAEGNQFVWVPVSNVNADGTGKIKVDENTEVEITLGRYTFDGTTGKETLIQKGEEYAATTLATVQDGSAAKFAIGRYYELAAFRESTIQGAPGGTNATAKNLKGFIESVKSNRGYYIARYEASYGSGSILGVGNNSNYYKPASQKSKAPWIQNGTSKLVQGEVSKISRQMYYGNQYVESDLVNSYMWDTTIAYVQLVGNDGYSYQLPINDENQYAGEDEVCHINMLARNGEFTTEYSTRDRGYYVEPCTVRGTGYPAYRTEIGAADRVGRRFRVGIWIK